MAKRAKSKQTTAAQPAITFGEVVKIPLNKLGKALTNVRQTDANVGIAELADSIAERSLLQSLSVRAVLDTKGQETGLYAVQGGSRRLAALQLLADQGRIAGDEPIPCIIKHGGLAEEDSLAENADRVDLHLLDQFRAFKALVDKGRRIEDVAASFKVTPAVVRQRLRLASVNPALLEFYASDEMTLEDLMAFTVSDDHARQQAVWDVVKDRSWDREAEIKRLLTEKTIPAHDKRVRFVGLATYEAAGGSVLRDLFDEACEGYLQNPELLAQLVTDKLNAEAAKLKAEGWKWVMASVDGDYAARQSLRTIQPDESVLTDEETARLAELEAEWRQLEQLDEMDEQQAARTDELTEAIDALENKPPVYSAHDKARAGAFIAIGHNGALTVHLGYIRPEDEPADEASVEGPAPLTDGSTEPDDLAPKLSEALMQDLTSYHTVALRESMTHDFSVAFLAVLHALCLQVFYRDPTLSCLQITAQTGFPARAPGLDDWKPTDSLAKQASAWTAQLPRERGELWDALTVMDSAMRQHLFAYCAASTLNAVREPHARRHAALDHAHHVARSLGLHMVSAGWSPTVQNYLGRVPKALILDAVSEAKGEETASLIAHLKKDVMAHEAERLLQGTGWLPAILRTDDHGPAEMPASLPAFLIDPTAPEATT